MSCSHMINAAQAVRVTLDLLCMFLQNQRRATLCASSSITMIDENESSTSIASTS